jgi:hypothetical protein
MTIKKRHYVLAKREPIAEVEPISSEIALLLTSSRSTRI